MERLRILLILARASNLPTVWSNCLAGWVLGGGTDWVTFFWLCFGATFIYAGGMFLNDAFDADFDRQHRSERPIPSGRITSGEVWLFGFGWLALGLAAAAPISRVTAILAVLLITSVLIYDAIHKVVTFAPVVMALCRFLLYLMAASAGYNGVTGRAVWSALAIAGYIVGLSYLARRESTRGPLTYWPMIFLGAPLILAVLVHGNRYQKEAMALGSLLVLWVGWCLRHVIAEPTRNVGYTVSGLLAGIVLVDFLAVGIETLELGAAFVILFALARLFQRFIPAT